MRQKIYCLLFILYSFIGCKNVTESEYPIIDIQAKKLFIQYAESLKKEFVLPEVKLMVEINKVAGDSILIYYSKIDERDFKTKNLKNFVYNCEEIDGYTLFYMTSIRSKKSNNISNDCFKYSYKEDYDIIRDYYPMKMLIVNGTVKYNETTSVQNVNWLGPPPTLNPNK